MANVGMHRHVGFYVDVLLSRLVANASCSSGTALLETRLDSSHIISLTPQTWHSRWQQDGTMFRSKEPGGSFVLCCCSGRMRDL